MEYSHGYKVGDRLVYKNPRNNMIELGTITEVFTGHCKVLWSDGQGSGELLPLTYDSCIFDAQPYLNELEMKKLLGVK